MQLSQIFDISTDVVAVALKIQPTRTIQPKEGPKTLQEVIVIDEK